MEEGYILLWGIIKTYLVFFTTPKIERITERNSLDFRAKCYFSFSK